MCTLPVCRVCPERMVPWYGTVLSGYTGREHVHFILYDTLIRRYIWVYCFRYFSNSVAASHVNCQDNRSLESLKITPINDVVWSHRSLSSSAGRWKYINVFHWDLRLTYPKHATRQAHPVLRGIAVSNNKQRSGPLSTLWLSQCANICIGCWLIVIHEDYFEDLAQFGTIEILAPQDYRIIWHQRHHEHLFSSHIDPKGL